MTDYRPPADDAQPLGDATAPPGFSPSPMAPQAAPPLPSSVSQTPASVASMAPPAGAPYGANVGGGANPVLPTQVPQRPWRSPTDAFARVTIGLLLVQVALYAYTISLDEGIMSALEQRDYQGMLDLSASAPPLPGISSLLYVATAVFFLIWLHRVWTSERSDPSWYSRSSGLAVGGWFIPLAAWVMGPMALRDLWTGTRQARPGAMPQPRRMPGLVVCYAVAWAVGSLLTLSSRGLIAQTNAATTREGVVTGLQQALQTEMSAVLVSAVAAILLVVVIVKISGFTKR